ncbi:MAG: hypothetical protein M1834_003387 [Cirrosporium novae-zelandiae]|nr:MAG: hypothetical protein M1834_003387 [Cirrosporium novae-zelandiae]
MFAFVLTAIFFAVCALFAGLLALCSRIGSYFSGFLASIALFFQTIAASLMTAAYVKGRDNFHSNGQSAKLGVKAFAFMWTAFACLFLAMILFCIGGSTNRAPYTAKRSRFGRKRSTRSRGSFIENRRSKNEYS